MLLNIITIICLSIFILKIFWNFAIAYWASARSKLAADGKGISLMPIVEIFLIIMASIAGHFSKINFWGIDGGIKILAIGTGIIILSYMHMMLVCRLGRRNR